MGINIYDYDKEKWKQISSLLAKNQILVDAAGNYDSENVEDALKEIADKLGVIKADVQYIYENGTIGGGGGGGGSLPKVTTSFNKTNVTSTEIVSIPFQFTSPNIGKGTVIGRLNGIEVLRKACDIGPNTWTFDGPLDKREHIIELYVIDIAGLHSNMITIKLTCGELEIEYITPALSTFIVGTPVVINYKVVSLSSDRHDAKYTINGIEQPRVENIGKGNVRWNVGSLPKGRHVVSIKVYVNEVESNALTYNIAVVEANELYIGSTFDKTEVVEGMPFTIPFITSLKNHEECYVDCYIDNEIEKTMRIRIGEGAWTINGLFKKAQNATYEIKLIARTLNNTATSAPLVFNLRVIDNPYDSYPHHTENLVAWFKADSMSNDEATRNVWKNEVPLSSVTCTLYDFNYMNNGYINVTDNSEDQYVDEQGQVIYNKGLFINGEAYAVIDYSPFAQNGGTDGFTIEMTVRVDNVGNLDSFAMFCATNAGANKPDRGMWLNTYETCLDSVAVKNKVSIGEGNWARISYVVDKKEKYTKIYIDSVLSGIAQISDQENFLNASKIYLNCGINATDQRYNFGQCMFKSIKIYDAPLTYKEILKNYIAEIFNKNIQRQKSIANNTSKLPYLYIRGIKGSLNTPANPTEGKNFYVQYEPKEGGGGFTKSTCNLKYQGTSTAQFATSPNFTFKSVLYGVEGDTGEGIPDYLKVKDEWEQEYIYTLKSNFMESSHSNNIGIASFVHDMLGMRAPAIASGDAKRCAVDGFPVILKTCWTDETSDMSNFTEQGVYMFNLDRYSSNNYGLKAGCLVYEGANNDEGGAVAFDDYSDASISKEWKLIYPPGEAMATHTEFSKLIRWVKESPDQNFGNKAEFETHLSLDHCINYFLMMYVFGMIDSIGKNLRMSSWGAEGGFDYKWYPTFYDLDTALGLNNEGHFNVPPHVELDTVQEGAQYNVKNSKLWRRLEQLYKKDIEARYADLRKNKIFDVDAIINLFKELIIDKISEAQYNEDAINKYYVDLDEGKTSDGLQMAQGTRIQKVKRWIVERLTFCDSMFGYEPKSNNTVQFRTNSGGEKVSLSIKTYEPQYLSVKFNASNDGTVTEFCSKDKFTVFSGISTAEQNQEMFIYSADNLMEIGGLNGKTNVSSLFMQNARRLRKLDVSGSKAITELRIQSMEMLQELYCYNCPSLKYFINVSSCSNLRILDAHGTAETRNPITGVAFADGGSLTKLDLSYTDVSEVKLVAQPFLREINLTGCNKLVTFSITNCPKLEKIVLPQADLEIFIASQCPNLESIDINTGKNLKTVQLYELDKLKTLNVSKNYKITSFLNLTGCRNLETLNAESCSNLKLIAFHEDAKASLKNINLSTCTSFYGIKTFSEMLVGNLVEEDFGIDPCLNLDGFSALSSLNFYNCQSLTRVRNLTYVAPGSTSMFYNCSSLEALEQCNLTLRDNINDLFRGCAKLTTLPVFNFLAVTGARRSFEGCKKLTLQDLVTIMNCFSSNLRSQYRMFAGCTGIIATGTGFPSSLFNKCSGLTTLSEMFVGCNGITSEFPENLLAPLKSLTDCYHAFSSCKFTGKLKANTFSCITNGATNTKITSVYYMFGANNFTDYDEGIFRSLVNLGNVEYFFTNNPNLCRVDSQVVDKPNYVKEELFANNPNLTTARHFFDGTPLYGTLWKPNPEGGADLPILLFKNNKKLQDISYFFNGTNLTGPIPEDIFKNCDDGEYSSLIKIAYFFSNTKINGVIPTKLLLSNNNITDASGLFHGCSALTYEIIIERDEEGNETKRYNQPFPPALLNSKPELAYVSNFFYGCSGLRGDIPKAMLFGSPKIEKVNGLFHGCSALTGQIPEDLLSYSTRISDASYLFYNCNKLLTVLPDNLFKNCSEVITLEYAFYNCDGLRDGIPEGFLDACVKLQSVRGMFEHCEIICKLGTNHTYAIPENLFLNCPELNNTSRMFYYCYNLKGATKQIDINTTKTYGIPPNLFYANTKLNDTSYMFWRCHALGGEIPEDLFGQQGSDLQFVQFMFAECYALNKIYKDLFGHVDSVTGIYDGRLPGILNFEETFSSCSALRGEVPELWISHRGAKSTKCYVGVTGVDNTIDGAWK